VGAPPSFLFVERRIDPMSGQRAAATVGGPVCPAGTGEVVKERKILPIIAKILGLGVLLVVAYRTVDVHGLLASLASLAPVAVLALVGVSTVDRFLMATKWRQLCGAIGVVAPFRTFLSAYYAASFLSFCVPTTLGGDVYRAVRLSRVADGHGVVASLILEKLVAVFATIAFAWGGLAVLLRQGAGGEARTVFLVLLAVSFLAVALFSLSFHPGLHRFALRLTGRARVREALGKLSDAYRTIGDRRGALAGNFLLAVLENGVQLGLLYAAGRALGLDLAPLTFLAIIAVTQFVRRLSMIFDAWGLSEAVTILMYGLVGIDGSRALAISLLGHAVTSVASVPGGLVLLGARREQRGEPAPSRASGLRRFAQRFLVPPVAVSVYYGLRDKASVSPRAEVEVSGLLRFGRGCTVSSFTKIKATEGPLRIGARSGFATGCFVSAGAAGIEIGNDVLCGPNVAILGSHYGHHRLDVPFSEQERTSQGVRIGNNVWIGAGSVITDGAVLGDNTIVAANSLVSRRYPPAVIIQGAPARIILQRDRTPTGDKTCVTRYSASSRTPSRTSTTS
jgi:acetyltransferase-like isoleucine patch superfamily enzyme/uncharacterized membrane protein YbhN (UPF0104 family)